MVASDAACVLSKYAVRMVYGALPRLSACLHDLCAATILSFYLSWLLPAVRRSHKAAVTCQPQGWHDMQPESAACTSKGLQHLSLLVELQAEPATVLGLDEVDHAADVVHHVEVVAVARRVLHLAPHCPAVSNNVCSKVCSGMHCSVCPRMKWLCQSSASASASASGLKAGVLHVQNLNALAYGCVLHLIWCSKSAKLLHCHYSIFCLPSFRYALHAQAKVL